MMLFARQNNHHILDYWVKGGFRSTSTKQSTFLIIPLQLVNGLVLSCPNVWICVLVYYIISNEMFNLVDRAVQWLLLLHPTKVSFCVNFVIFIISCLFKQSWSSVGLHYKVQLFYDRISFVVSWLTMFCRQFVWLS